MKKTPPSFLSHRLHRSSVALTGAYRRPLVFLFLLLGLGTAFGRTATNAPRPHGRRFDVVYLSKNQWRMPITNYGTFGHDVARGTAGGEWPRGSGDLYIFGAGIWFGSIKQGSAGIETTVTCGYNPNSGKSEFTPGAWANAGGGYASRDFERVYMYPEDWPPDPTVFPASMQDSFLTSLKVPLPSGETISNYFDPIPRKAISSGDCWSVFNDGDPANEEYGGTGSGIEVYQNTYGWSLPWNRDVVFFVYNVRNVTTDTISNAYMAMCCDGDIGSAGNDYCGSSSMTGFTTSRAPSRSMLIMSAWNGAMPKSAGPRSRACWDSTSSRAPTRRTAPAESPALTASTTTATA